MAAYFFDSSAFAKLFIVEAESPRVIHAYEFATEVFVSYLAPFEVRSAIRRRQNEGDLTQEDARLALNDLSREALIANVIPWGGIHDSVVESVIDLHRLRALDAIQLACALSIRSPFIFLSSDRRLLGAASLAGLNVLDPSRL